MRLIINFFINSNIWVAFCVLGLIFSTEILLAIINAKISQFVFFSTIFTYNFQRIVRLKKGHEHSYKNWLDYNIKAIYFLMFIAGSVSLYLFYGFKLRTQTAILFIGFLSVFYPYFLREIPFAKIFIISFVWTVSTSVLLVLENNVLISQNIIWHFVSRFLFVFAITIPFDIRDQKYDTNKIFTLPVYFGVKTSKNIAFISLFFCILIVLFQYAYSLLNFSDFLALTLLYITSSLFVFKSDEKKEEIYFSFWVEALSVCSYLFLIITHLTF